MKPIELDTYSDNQGNSGYAEANRLYNSFKNQECVIAYRKCFMGTAFVVQGKRDMFGFIILNSLINRWNHTSEIQRKSLKEIKLLFECDGNTHTQVIEKELYAKFERMVLFNSL